LKVVISWSGDRSHRIAQIFREWLPTVLPGIDAWMSSHDIGKGRPWQQELTSNLSETNWGILIVLPENQNSAWLNFEAGAISKWVDFANVAPILFGLTPSDLRGPLANFQATVFSKDDFLRLLKSLRTANRRRTPGGSIEISLDYSWPSLSARIETVLGEQETPPASANNSASDKAGPALSEEQIAILSQIGTSDGNFMLEGDVAKSLQMKMARAQLLLSELVETGYLSGEHISMLGTCYSVTPKGSRYLSSRGVI
jgi:TIR domain